MTDEVASRIVTLPLYPHMHPDDVAVVADALETAVRRRPLTPEARVDV